MARRESKRNHVLLTVAALAPHLADSLPQSLKEQGVVDHAFVLECHEHKHHEQISVLR